MKLTKTKLKQIIKEELQAFLSEQEQIKANCIYKCMSGSDGYYLKGHQVLKFLKQNPKFKCELASDCESLDSFKRKSPFK